MIEDIDYNKYIVVKMDDFKQFLDSDEQEKVLNILAFVEYKRQQNLKPKNQYLVLNMDDRVNLTYLIKKIMLLNEKLRFNTNRKTLTIRTIAIDLINSILINRWTV